MNDRTRIPLHYLGWGLLLAWVLCTFYTRIIAQALFIGGIETTGGFAQRAALTTAPVFFVVATIVALIVSERRFANLASNRTLSAIAACITAAFTPLMFLGTGNAQLDGAAYLLGGMASGIGSGFMWVSWGALYAELEQEATESASIISCAAAILIALGTSAMVDWTAVGLVSSLPLISGWMLSLSRSELGTGSPMRARTEAANRSDAKNRAHPLKALSRVWKGSWGLLYLSVFICIVGSYRERSDPSSPFFQAVLVAGVVLVVCIGLMAQFGPRQTSIAFLCRWACPLAAAALALLAFDIAEVEVLLASSIALLCRFSFCMITQMHFARFAKRGLATPTQAYGLGWILIHVGDLVGLVIFEIARANHLTDERLFPLAALVALVAGIMVFLGRDDSFVAPARTEESCLSAKEGCADASDPRSSAPSAGVHESHEQRIKELARAFELTERETAVFSLLMRGRSVPYIRDELVISKNTVATHVKHIYAKSGVHTRQELLDLL